MKQVFAIGALGGSGTRVIAQILKESGVQIGNVLNYPNDNLVFTALFKNPKWYNCSTKYDKQKRFKIFQKYMYGELSFFDFFKVIFYALSNKIFRYNYSFYYMMLFNKRVLKSSLWGWKEPNTQIYIKEINNFFPSIKYIHVLRNGLDMAFSDNKAQLYNWGYKYNIFINDSDDSNSIAIKQLDYWIESTKEVIKNRSLLSERFYLLNYDKFCLQTDSELKKLIDFIDIPLKSKKIKELEKLFKAPKSLNRYKNYNIDIFRRDQIEFVKSKGFL